MVLVHVICGLVGLKRFLDGGEAHITVPNDMAVLVLSGVTLSAFAVIGVPDVQLFRFSHHQFVQLPSRDRFSSEREPPSSGDSGETESIGSSQALGFT